MEKINARIAVNTDSNKYCNSNCFFPAPTTFFMPTSFALLTDLAVARLV
jgi:hypothetical protein